MNKILVIFCVIFGLIFTFISVPESVIAIFLILIIAVPSGYLIHHYSNGNGFLLNVFVLGLLLRLLLGLFIYIFDLRGLFGPDSYLYDTAGARLVDIWSGLPVPEDTVTYRVTKQGSGWGMYYLVGVIYYIFGKNLLVAQSFCGVIGALTAPMVYFCANTIFSNQRVAKISAMLIALFPSFIIWSSQLLKDGIIVFLLVCVMVLILQLQKKLNYFHIFLLVTALFGILTLRFYIFYMVILSVAGSFVIGLSSSVQSMVRNIVAVILVGLALTYLGVIRNAQSDISTFANLERVQLSREDLSNSADSGFGEDIDVSTPAGAIAAVPIGLLYLYFAPFPWNISKFNQALVVPETLIWWCLIPVMISGLVYTLKNKLRNAIPILIFSLMLSLAYSIFQGNVGMLYRQRTQIQVFLFIFIAVGVTLVSERTENKRMVEKEKERRKLLKLDQKI